MAGSFREMPFLELYYARVVFLKDRPGAKYTPASKKILVNRNSTFEEVEAFLPGWTLLRPTPGALLHWTEARHASRIGFPCRTLYAFKRRDDVPYILGAVRTQISDYPVVVYQHGSKPSRELVMLADSSLKDTTLIVTLYSSMEDTIPSIDRYYAMEDVSEMILGVDYRGADHSGPEKGDADTFRVLFITSSTPSEEFQIDAPLSSIPPFLQILFVSSKELLQLSHELKRFPLQMIHLSSALSHAISSLSASLETYEESFGRVSLEELTQEGTERVVDELVGDVVGKQAGDLSLEDGLQVALLLAEGLQTLLNDLVEVSQDISERTLDIAAIQPKLDRIFVDLCGDYPGAVTIRHSHRKFERLKAIDHERIRSSGEAPGRLNAVVPEITINTPSARDTMRRVVRSVHRITRTVRRVPVNTTRPADAITPSNAGTPANIATPANTCTCADRPLTCTCPGHPYVFEPLDQNLHVEAIWDAYTMLPPPLPQPHENLAIPLRLPDSFLSRLSRYLARRSRRILNSMRRYRGPDP